MRPPTSAHARTLALASTAPIGAITAAAPHRVPRPGSASPRTAAMPAAACASVPPGPEREDR